MKNEENIWKKFKEESVLRPVIPHNNLIIHFILILRYIIVEVESDKFNVNDEYYGLTADIINDQQNEDTTRLLTPVIIRILIVF